MTTSKFDTAKKEARLEGEIKGRLEGNIEGRLEIAKNMKKEGLDALLLSKLTGLTEQEILQI